MATRVKIPKHNKQTNKWNTINGGCLVYAQHSFVVCAFIFHEMKTLHCSMSFLIQCAWAQLAKPHAKKLFKKKEKKREKKNRMLFCICIAIYIYSSESKPKENKTGQKRLFSCSRWSCRCDCYVVFLLFFFPYVWLFFFFFLVAVRLRPEWVCFGIFNIHSYSEIFQIICTVISF